MDSERLTRIRTMERAYDKTARALSSLEKAAGRFIPLRDCITQLKDYMDSGRWLSDYEADERGELPAGLKRGVLSQDALYNLLSSVKEVLGRLDEMKPL